MQIQPFPQRPSFCDIFWPAIIKCTCLYSNRTRDLFALIFRETFLHRSKRESFKKQNRTKQNFIKTYCSYSHSLSPKPSALFTALPEEDHRKGPNSAIELICKLRGIPGERQRFDLGVRLPKHSHKCHRSIMFVWGLKHPRENSLQRTPNSRCKLYQRT